jgi:adhesin transport system outer membrane protein
MKCGTAAAAAFVGALWFTTALTTPTYALTLQEALRITVESNPEIGQAVENREAIEFELRQARGLYLPSVDLNSSGGVRQLDNVSRRLSGEDDDELYPRDVGITVTQKLFDGGARSAEKTRQASRVDSASYRVLERSETIGLQVVREYLEVVLQAEIAAETRRNLEFHERTKSDIGDLISGGKLTDADRQQVDERLLGARARSLEAHEELEAAKIRFYTLVGKPMTGWSMPPSVGGAIPKTLDEAIAIGRKNNPRIQAAMADINVAEAMVKSSRSKYMPEVFAEGSARTGEDIDGDAGRTNDYSARVVAKWNLYRGGIDSADEQEQIRRASETRLVLHQSHRQVEEAVRISWDRRARQTQQAATLGSQANENQRLVGSYREQLDVGQRSLLDVLDAQNTYYNASILAKTARFAARFAEYRLLAATGQLLRTMEVRPPQQAEAYARTEYNVPPALATETYRRVPSRQSDEAPMDLLAPVKTP